MTRNSFDASLSAWLDRQDPPRRPDRVAAAVMREVARTNQAQRPSQYGALSALGAAAVIIGLVILASLELQPPIGPNPSVAPSPTGAATVDGERLPPGATAMNVGSRAWGNLDEIVVGEGSGGAIWVRDSGTRMTRTEIVRIDRTTGETTASLEEVVDVAMQGDEMWALFGTQPSICCEPVPLVQLDPATGSVIRTIPGVTGLGLTLDEGTAWVTDGRSLIHVDLRGGIILSTIDVPDGPSSSIVFDGAVWLRCECDGATLVRVNPHGERVDGALLIPGLGFIAGGEGAIWAKTDGEILGREGASDTRSQILRIDPDTMDVVATLQGIGEGISYGTLIVSHGFVWTAGPGQLLRIDPSDNSISEAAPLPWGKFRDMVVVGDELWTTVADPAIVIHFPLPLP